MYVLVLANDKPGTLDKRLATRPRHVDYWRNQPGVVMLAGAMLSDSGADANPKGSAILLKVEDEATVRRLLAEDPYTLEGVFGDDVRIEIIRPALGDWLPAQL